MQVLDERICPNSSRSVPRDSIVCPYCAADLGQGGGVDTQQTLPFGTPEEVRREVLERLEILAPGGGFVFDTIHNIQPRTPVENLLAMFEALREFDSAS